jgi:flavin reductase (DIM6/NTAB) family NADH-FMN oxidoreductase RutF
MTANGIASISLDPMLVMVCVGHKANTHPIIESTGRYGINILSESQKDIGNYYAMSDDKRDDSVKAQFHFSERGIPFLAEALSSMDCKVLSTHIEGDHTVFIALVEEIEVRTGSPLLFFEGRWSALGDSI